MNTDLLKGNILKALIVFAIPMFISNIFQQLYNAADTMIVGNFLGDGSLAAIGACTAVFELMVGFALGIGNGLSIVVARSYGSGNKEQLKRTVAGMLIIGGVLTILVMVASKLFMHPLLELLHTPTNIIAESYSYISTITAFVAVMIGYNLCAGVLRAIGNSIMPLIFLIISSVLNIVLDILFITQFGMGIRGAAVATVIAQGVSVILCLVYIFLKCPMLIPSREHFRFDKTLYRELLGQGLSMGFMVSIVSMGTVVLQTSINGLGYLTIAGHTAARKLNSFSMLPIVTLAMSISTFVSQNKGADQGDRIRQAVKYANLMAIAWGGFVTVILFFAAPAMVKFLSGSTDTTVIANGATYLRLNSPFYAVLGMLLNLRFSLQGIGSKMLPLVSSVIEFAGKTLFVLLVIPSLGYLGVIICEPAIWCFMCAQLFYSFYKNPYIREFRNRKSQPGT